MISLLDAAVFIPFGVISLLGVAVFVCVGDSSLLDVAVSISFGVILLSGISVLLCDAFPSWVVFSPNRAFQFSSATNCLRH